MATRVRVGGAQVLVMFLAAATVPVAAAQPAAAGPAGPQRPTAAVERATPAADAARVRTRINKIPTEPLLQAVASVVADRIRVRTGNKFRIRQLLIERRQEGKRRWIPSDRGRTDRDGWFLAQLDPGGVGTWQFRATALPTDDARRKRRLMRTITVTGTIGAGAGVLWSQLAAGQRHTCALDQRGMAYCWGDGGWGALGNGGLARIDLPSPVSTAGQLRGRQLRQLTAGSYHTCALDLEGSAHCWGDGTDGQLGDGSDSVRRTAVGVQMPDATRFTRLSAGRAHTCAVSTEGEAYCWGAGGAGQLGTGETTGSAKPVQPDLGRRISVVDIAAGGSHTCALSAGGTAWCWGAGSWGQLGDGRTRDSLTPVAVTATDQFVAIAAGSDFTCAQTAAGKVLCWGAGTRGQLGDGLLLGRAEPAEVTLSGPVDSLSAAGSTACARDIAASTLWCWGANTTGQVGDGTFADAAVPRPVSVPGPGVVAAATGGAHACAITADGAAYCWGSGERGQLGDDLTQTWPVPVRVLAPIR